MPNSIKNWKYKEVKKFLEKNGFVLINVRGSHHYFSGSVDKIPRMVTVPFHGARSILPRTMNSIISQSGILKTKWFIK